MVWLYYKQFGSMVEYLQMQFEKWIYCMRIGYILMKHTRNSSFLFTVVVGGTGINCQLG